MRHKKLYIRIAILITTTSCYRACRCHPSNGTRYWTIQNVESSTPFPAVRSECSYDGRLAVHAFDDDAGRSIVAQYMVGHSIEATAIH